MANPDGTAGGIRNGNMTVSNDSVVLFGYRFTVAQGYVISWAIMLALLVLIASKNAGLALGFALTILFAVAIVVTNSQGTVLP